MDEKTAASIYGEMESFASYAFNKSHAAAYANIAYQTAWLKYHYPKEYLAALLTSVLDNSNKLAAYTAECQRLHIKVLPPHVNISTDGFTVSGDDIRFGLMAIKNLGRSFIDEIVAERANGKYTSFYNFCKRLYGKGMNSRAVESLIKSGALDDMGHNRREMLSGVKTVLDGLEQDKRRNMDGQLSFFDSEELAGSGEPQLEPLDDFTITERLAMEKEVTGMYLSGHPMAEYAKASKAVKADQILKILESEGAQNSRYQDGARVRVLAIISRVKLKATKNNSMMAFVTLEDMTGAIEMLVFPQTLAEYGTYFLEGSVVDVLAGVSLREEEEPKLLCNQVKPASKEVPRDTQGHTPPEANRKPAYSAGQQRSTVPVLYLRLKNMECEEYERARQVLDIFDEGRSPVVFVLSDTGKRLRAPAQMWVDLNDVMINELKRRIGEDNVAVK